MSCEMVLRPFNRCSRADFSAPSGWLPFRGRSSCCGSPRRTSFLAAWDTASTSAKDIWPASSMKSTSTTSEAEAVDHNQEVAPRTLAFPERSAANASSLSFLATATPSLSWPSFVAMHATYARDMFFPSCLNHGVKQVANNFVAERGYANFLALFD